VQRRAHRRWPGHHPPAPGDPLTSGELAPPAGDAHNPGRLAPLPVRVLLVEDDEGDAFLVRELLLDAGSDVELTRAHSLAEAVLTLPGDIDCVLLDLGLPDATGLDGLRAVLEISPNLAVLVLTGLTDEHRGTEAVAVGAQDYLVKGGIDGQLLTRAIRYAVERKRADESVRRLYASEARAAENARLERGLLPQPLVRGDWFQVVARYRPGRHQSVLGGDFYDVVECDDGAVFALIGDVAGHGPDEAALGVCLRIAWRTLVLSGADPDAILGAMDAVLVSERSTDELFATVAMVRLTKADGMLRLWRAGHPLPVIIEDSRVVPAPEGASGVALGVVDGFVWEPTDRKVGRDTSVLLFTDGLIEGFDGHVGGHRLGEAALYQLLEELLQRGDGPEQLLDDVLAEVRERNGGELTDDVAAVVLTWAGWE
jgi:serine phosphatase RsbU (regulator of sigma subunit)